MGLGIIASLLMLWGFLSSKPPRIWTPSQSPWTLLITRSNVTPMEWSRFDHATTAHDLAVVPVVTRLATIAVHNHLNATWTWNAATQSLLMSFHSMPPHFV